MYITDTAIMALAYQVNYLLHTAELRTFHLENSYSRLEERLELLREHRVQLPIGFVVQPGAVQLAMTVLAVLATSDGTHDHSHRERAFARFALLP